MMPGIDGTGLSGDKARSGTKARKGYLRFRVYRRKNEKRLKNAGVERCFSKPVNTAELLEAVGLQTIRSEAASC